MKKLIVLLAVVVMSMSASAWAADVAVNPKLEKAKELRVQAAKLQLQARDLIAEAADIEIAANTKPGEKMRGIFGCVRDCMVIGSAEYDICEKVCTGINGL